MRPASPSHSRARLEGLRPRPNHGLTPAAWEAPNAAGFVVVNGPNYAVVRTYRMDETRLMRADTTPLSPVVTSLREQQLKDFTMLINRILRESEEHVAFAREHVRQVDQSNDRVIRTLSAATGHSPGEDKESWRKWWAEERGYAYEPTAAQPLNDLTLDADKPVEYREIVGTSCFAAGTPVRTLAGPRPIESIAIGDQVLTQDPQSGALSFRPVIAAMHNKPAGVLKIDLGRERIRATGIHRFWKAGHGWVMARDLKPGDKVRGLGGVATVKAVVPDGVEPVYNLEVMQTDGFFVGDQGVLVHDNGEVRPVPRPFDSAPEPNNPALVRR